MINKNCNDILMENNNWFYFTNISTKTKLIDKVFKIILKTACTGVFIRLLAKLIAIPLRI